MAPDQPQARGSLASRRSFLKGLAVLAMAGAAAARGRAQPQKPSGKKRLAYVGTYSSGKSQGNANRGQGIYLFEMDGATGALAPRQVYANLANPSWLAWNPSRTVLYSANETMQFEGQASGSVSAYAVDGANGHLTLLNTVSSQGAGPAHLSVHPSGRYVLVANYAGGSVAVLPIGAHGALGSAADVHRDPGPVGPERSTDAPRGNFSISGHGAPHPHMIQSDPSGRFVISTDLGMDRIFVWKFDVERGKLHDPRAIAVPPGDGPRHFVFHPNGRWFYCLQEEGSVVIGYDYDGSSGRLAQKQIVSTLPADFAGTNFPSGIRISPDGRFVYAANRRHNSIARFSVGRHGKLAYLGEEWTRGGQPRSIALDPWGDFLYSCNQRSDALTAFRVHRSTGRLSFTGQYTPVGAPAAMVFL
jgi:6-phosphogluconolactonase